MRPAARIRDLAGWLALAAMLALSSPGVSAVRAAAGEPGPQGIPEAGPACGQDPAAAGQLSRSVTLDLSRLAARAAQQGEAAVVVLDTAGYRYDQRAPADASGAAVRIGVVPAD